MFYAEITERNFIIALFFNIKNLYINMYIRYLVLKQVTNVHLWTL